MIKHVMIIGYGTMGKGIALSFSRGGHKVTVLSRTPGKVDPPPVGIEVIGEFPTNAPDLIIETVPEDLELKTALFTRVEQTYGGKPIIATNTSGLSMTDMARTLSYPEQFIGVHYFHPAEIFPSVEVIRVEQTKPDVVENVVEALKKNGQDAILINEPIQGFLLNRLQHAILHEAFSMIQQGLVTAENVDQACKTIFGPRMCVTGLIEQKDISGLAITASTQRNLVPCLNHSGVPSQNIQDMVERGEVGVKSGKGFYDWSDIDVEEYKKRAMKKVKLILEILSG